MNKLAVFRIARTFRPTLVGRVRFFQSTVARFNDEFDPEGTRARLRANEKVLPFVSDTLDNLKFRALTKVQDKTIVPAIEAEKGLTVRAKTGTGKTLAFLIPILNDLFPGRTHSLKNKWRVFHLIIVPTRDLALQIERELTLFCKGNKELETFLTRIDVLTGGKRSFLESKFSPSIVIATPGRLSAVLREKKKLAQRFRSLRTLVLDEADRLLDKGFREDLETIDAQLRELNVGVQRGEDVTYKYMLYSATIDQNVESFAQEKIGPDSEYIDCVEKEDTEAHENINQVLVKTNDANESIHAALAECIKGLDSKPHFKSIVFLPTIKSVDWFHSTLKQSLMKPLARKVFKVTGQMTQSARDRNLLNYRRSDGGILICTDVAARGLDFPDINTVIQVSPSVEPASYIHKIGRTGRAGKKGEAIQFSTKDEGKYINTLETEKQIEFNETRTYETFEEDKQLMKYETDEEIYHEACRSLLLYYFQVNNTYRLNSFNTLKGVVNFHQTVTGTDEPLPCDPKLISLSRLRRHEAHEIFDVPPGFNNFSRKTNSFDRGSGGSGGNGKFQRFSGYGGNRGGYSGNRDYNNRGSSYGGSGGSSYNRGGNRGSYGGNRGGDRAKSNYRTGGFSGRDQRSERKSYSDRSWKSDDSW